MNQYPGVTIKPKSKSELFLEYENSVSICTFRKWLKGLASEGKIRAGMKVLTSKEVEIVYKELGVPIRFTQLQIDFT